LGVADRLELALYCLQNRVIDANAKQPNPSEPTNGKPANGSAGPPMPEPSNSIS
jgi:hypothetical protein